MTNNSHIHTYTLQSVEKAASECASAQTQHKNMMVIKIISWRQINHLMSHNHFIRADQQWTNTHRLKNENQEKKWVLKCSEDVFNGNDYFCHFLDWYHKWKSCNLSLLSSVSVYIYHQRCWMNSASWIKCSRIAFFIVRGNVLFLTTFSTPIPQARFEFLCVSLDCYCQSFEIQN